MSNRSGFLGNFESDQDFNISKYSASAGAIPIHNSLSDNVLICEMPPASDLIDIGQQYKLEGDMIISCNKWSITPPEYSQFVPKDGKWFYRKDRGYPWADIELGVLHVTNVFLIVKDISNHANSTLLIRYCHGFTCMEGITILSYSDYQKCILSKGFPWDNTPNEALMNKLFLTLIKTSPWLRFIPPKHSGWSTADNGVLFHAQGFDYLDMVRDYYPDGCSQRIYLDDKMKVFPKEYLNQKGLPWQVTVANLLRLSSLLLSFFKEESIELKQMFLLHCSERETADQFVALLKNDQFDSRTAHSLQEKNIDKILNATNDGVVLFRYEAPLDGKKARAQGWNDIQRDINHTNGIDDYTNHLICVISDDSSIVEQRDMVCTLSLDDFSLNINAKDFQHAALHSDCRLIQFVKDKWRTIIRGIKYGINNTVIPESIPSHLRNTFLIIQITYDLVSTYIPELLPNDFEPQKISKWLSGEAGSTSTDQILTEQFRSVFISLLENKQLRVLNERRDVDGKLNAIAVTADDVFFDSSTLEKTIMPMIAYDIDRNRLLNALVKTGYLRATDKNEFRFRIHKSASDQKDTWLYCVRRSILGNKNSESLFIRQNEGKEEFLLDKDEIPACPFLPLIQHQSQYAGIKLARDGSDNRHLLISGKSHSGKTFALFHIAAQYASLGHHVIIFDTNGTLRATEINEHYSDILDDLKPDYLLYSVKSKGELPVNLLSLGDNEESSADNLCSLLSTGLINLPLAKFNQLQQDISAFYINEHNSALPNDKATLKALKNYISQLKSRSILQNNLNPLIDLICNYELPNRTWAELFTKPRHIIVISVPGSRMQRSNPLFNMLLFNLYQYQKYAFDKHVSVPLDIIVDELHDEDLIKSRMIREILEEGRHYQIGFAAGTHSFKTEKQLRAVMGNAAIKIFLKPDGESYKVLLAHLGDPAIDIDFLRNMKRNCIVEAEFYSKEVGENTPTILTGDFVKFGSTKYQNKQMVDLIDDDN